ncbi:ABC transporter permease [Microlunatus soli]|uniref:Transport permease protein n=1 Tax=Microlunatus soli TaxID=630515 RepID=A0A1H1U898_9ACTN|nr:ABC transporter permease [Microlunatus soli]SDS68728.1 ABC-2 type transport system permease protein [Microlunatus soli]
MTMIRQAPSTARDAEPRGGSIGPELRTRRPSAITTQLTFVGRSLRHSLRDPEALIMAVVMPVIMMLLFTYVFGGAIEDDGGYVNYVVPGVILLCAGFGSASTAVAVTSDLTNGVINRFRTMPVHSAMVIGGHVVASVVRNLFATVIVFGVAILIGYRPNATALAWLGSAGLITLYILAITTLFAALGILAKTASAANNYGFAVLFLPYLSSAFVPVATMPGWLQWIAGHQPITPIIETLRSLLMGTPMATHGWWALGWCLLILVGSSLWAGWLFPRRRR